MGRLRRVGSTGRLGRRPAVVVFVAISLVLVAGGAMASAHGGFESAAQAIKALNAQRRANGIPGRLQNVADISQGCWQYENIYVQKAGQYPHEEVPGQRGYTKRGNRAASLSDLYPGRWPAAPLHGNNETDNPWVDAPLHLTELFDPGDSYAWFGAGPSGLCMGTSSSDPLRNVTVKEKFPKPTFFSLPGNGVSDVEPSETASELPWTPQQAVHIPAYRKTGPNIILFPEDAVVNLDPIAVVFKLDSAVLTSFNARRTAIRVVSPTTPAPPSPPGWPKVSTVGGYSGNDYFVIPPHPLRSNTRYTLTVIWSNRTGVHTHYTQRVHFKTAGTSPY
jgi:hypothetical protein